jgi:hypothetical protein
VGGDLLEGYIPASRLPGPCPGQITASFQDDSFQIRDGSEQMEHPGLEPAFGSKVGGSVPGQTVLGVKQGQACFQSEINTKE